jgi:hypothetical protein
MNPIDLPLEFEVRLIAKQERILDLFLSEFMIFLNG